MNAPHPPDLPAIPTTIRVSVLDPEGGIRVEEREMPRPDAGQVLVQIGSVGICGSDVHYHRHGRIGDHVVRAPMVLGHEAGGRIVAVGTGVDPARIGSRVALEPGVPCGECRQCRADRYNLCPDVRFFATPPIDGAFAEYLVTSADYAYDIPDTVSDDAAGLLEPLSVGIWACRKAAVGAGSVVLVSGAGPIGLVTVQVARTLGAAEIVVSDISPERLAGAQRYGATRLVDVRTASVADQGLEYDAFIECSGAESALQQGLPAMAPAGTVVLVGMGSDTVALPVPLVQGRELLITGTFRYAHTYPSAIELAATGAVDLDGLVTAHYGLADVAHALDHSGDPGMIKTIIRPGD